MQTIATSDANEADSFVIHLVCAPGKDIHVSSVELLLPELRNRYSFKKRRGLDEIFVAEVAEPIRDSVSRINPGDRLVSIPDFELAIPGLIMSGLRLLVTVADDGVQYVMLRFRRFVGALKSAFSFEPGMNLESAVARERIAIEVLNDIVTPLFDIMSLKSRGLGHLYDTHRELLTERIEKIETRKEELTFHINLLQRYIAGCKSDLEAERSAVNGGESGEPGTVHPIRRLAGS